VGVKILDALTNPTEYGSSMRILCGKLVQKKKKKKTKTTNKRGEEEERRFWEESKEREG